MISSSFAVYRKIYSEFYMQVNKNIFISICSAKQIHTKEQAAFYTAFLLKAQI